MERHHFKYLAISLLVLLTPCFAAAQTTDADSQPAYEPVTKYDPKRNAAFDVETAIKEAQRADKRILLEVGGDWCEWCKTLDKFFEDNSELANLRDQFFVTVKINFSEENPNKQLLDRYGKISAYPHLFVLDSEGKLLQSQGTGVLESGKSYDLEKLTAFLKKWAPPRKDM